MSLSPPQLVIRSVCERMPLCSHGVARPFAPRLSHMPLPPLQAVVYRYGGAM